MAPKPDELSTAVWALMDGAAGSGRPKPGAAFLRAVTEYVAASRRFDAAQAALLAQVDAFEAAVRAADADADAEHAPDQDTPATGRARPRAPRGMMAKRAGQPGCRAARVLAGRGHRG